MFDYLEETSSLGASGHLGIRVRVLNFSHESSAKPPAEWAIVASPSPTMVESGVPDLVKFAVGSGRQSTLATLSRLSNCGSFGCELSQPGRLAYFRDALFF